MFRCFHEKTLWVVNFCKTKIKSSINLSLLYPSVSGQKFKSFSKTDFSDGESCFSNMLNMIQSSKFLDVRDGFFVNGRSSWMLLSFRFLIACTVDFELFISEEKLFVVSIGVVFASRFFRCAERQGINHLWWLSDEIGPLVVVSLYFTLHLYFRNVVNVPLSKKLTRCWRSFDWSYTISLGLFPKIMSVEYAIEKTPQSVVPTCLWHGDNWYCGNVPSGEKSCCICCRVSVVGSVFKLSKFLTSPLNDDNNIQ